MSVPGAPILDCRFADKKTVGVIDGDPNRLVFVVGENHFYERVIVDHGEGKICFLKLLDDFQARSIKFNDDTLISATA